MNYIIVELKTKGTTLQPHHTDKQWDILGQKDKHEKRQSSSIREPDIDFGKLDQAETR